MSNQPEQLARELLRPFEDEYECVMPREVVAVAQAIREAEERGAARERKRCLHWARVWEQEELAQAIEEGHQPIVRAELKAEETRHA